MGSNLSLKAWWGGGGESRESPIRGQGLPFLQDRAVEEGRDGGRACKGKGWKGGHVWAPHRGVPECDLEWLLPGEARAVGQTPVTCEVPEGNSFGSVHSALPFWQQTCLQE